MYISISMDFGRWKNYFTFRSYVEPKAQTESTKKPNRSSYAGSTFSVEN